MTGERRPGCPGTLRCKALCGHRIDVEAHGLARDADVAAMEQVTAMYPGDVVLYKAEHTMMTFKRWLLGKVGRV